MPIEGEPGTGRTVEGTRRAEALILLTLPFLLAALGYGWWWNSRYGEIRSGQEQTLRGMLTAWTAESVPASAFRRLLQAADRELWRPGVSPGRRQAVLRALHRRFPHLFTFTVLDSKGFPIPALCDHPQPRRAWQRLQAAYRKLLAGDSGPILALSSAVHSLLGGFIPPGRPMTGTLLRADPGRQRRWLFAAPPHPEGWFLAHLAVTADWFSLPLQDRIQRWNRRSSTTRFFLVHGAPPDFSQPGLATAPLQELWESLEAVTWRGDILWGQRRVGPRLTLVASRKTRHSQILRQEGTAVVTALFVLWIVTLGAGCHPSVAQAVGVTSIRLRLILAVAFAAALPLATIGVITRIMVREHGQKLEGDLFFRMEGALRDLDELAPVLVEKQVSSLLRRACSLSWPASRPDLWEKNLRLLYPLAPWDLAKIFGPDGRSLLTDSTHSSLVWNPEDLGLFEQSALCFMQRLRVRNPSAAPALSFIQGTLADMAERMGHLNEYTAGEERLFLQFIPLMDEGRIKSLLQLIWNRKRLEQAFLREHLLRFGRDLPDTRLLVWRPDTPERWFPRRSPLWRNLRSLFPAIRDHTGSFHGQIRLDGDSSLVTAIRSDFFPDSFLVTVTSDRFIRTELRQAISRVAGVGLLLAFGSILAALIFAHSFLHPISLLGQGIDALRTHDFSVRLPPTGKDELGQLIAAFNPMVEGLQDLAMAHSVQAAFIPATALQVPPFSICGRSTSQPTLGGQAFDYGRLDNQEIAFLIGTCRAPGVTAGLALALAKGILTHPRTSPDPALALKELEQVITPILGEGVPLEMIYGRLDPGRGTVRLAGESSFLPLLMTKEKAASLSTTGPVSFPSGAALLLVTGWGSPRPGSGQDRDGDFLYQSWLEVAGEPIDKVADHLQAALEKEEVPGTRPFGTRTTSFLLIDRSGAATREGAG